MSYGKDHTKYVYVPIAPNLDGEFDKNDPPTKTYGVDDLAGKLPALYNLMRNFNPTWQFIVPQRSWYNDKGMAIRILSADMKKLGTVQRSGDGIAVESAVIKFSTQSQRQFRESSDLKTVMGWVRKYVRHPNSEEHTKLLFEKTESQLSRDQAVTQNNLASKLHAMLRMGTTKVFYDNLELLKPYLLDNGVGEDEIQAFADANHAQDAARKNKRAFVNHDGYIVQQHADTRYAVIEIMPKGKHEYQIMEKLPDNIRGKVGMLKLVDEESCIDGIGYRVGKNIFFVQGK